MFIPNKYTNIYFSIIAKARNRTIDGYFECHHIIPKSIGGSNKSSNLVCLTAKEHFLCHWLLIKMTEGEDKKKMSYALWTMTRGSSKHERILSSSHYEIARRHFSHTVKKRKTSIETRKKQSESQKGKPRPYSTNNIKKARRVIGIWCVTKPDGSIEDVTNLAQFCRDNNLSQGNLCNGGKTKGFSAVRTGTVLIRSPE